MESLFSGGTIGKVGIGVQAFDRLGHDMSSRVTEHLQLIFRGTFRDMTVVVDDFHGIPSFFSGRLCTKKHPPCILVPGRMLKKHSRFHPACCKTTH